jgi:hypothetical protein
MGLIVGRRLGVRSKRAAGDIGQCLGLGAVKRPSRDVASGAF